MSRTPIRYQNFDGLLNNGVSDFMLRDNELTACKNVWMYKIGKLEKVPGYTKSASSGVFTANGIDFLHHYYDTANRVDYQIGAAFDGSNTLFKYRTTGAWSSTALTLTTAGSALWSAQSFIGKTYIVGYLGGSYYAPISVNGTTFTQSSSTDASLTNIPSGKYITAYRDKLYILNARANSTNYPSRTYFSNQPVNGVITWNLTDEYFFECGENDGDEITGGAVAVDRLLVFKKYSTWKHDGLSQKKIANIGCDSYKSIKVISDTIYWFNRHGFWMWNGSSPVLISERAKEYIDAIDPTKLDQVYAAEFYRGEYRAHIGTVTVNKMVYRNAWFCYDTLRQRCYIRCTFWSATTTDTVKVVGNYIEGGKQRMYFGDNDGHLYKFAEKSDRIFSDDGHEIDSFFETKMLDHGVPEDVKFSNHMTVFTKNCYGMKVAIDKDNSGEFSEDNADVLNNNIQQVEIAGSANRFKYRFYEKSDGLSWEFEGFVVETQVKEEAYAQ